MPEFQINYLGCGSATPTMRHQPTCQVVNFRGKLMMIDCGEGAQLQYRRMKLKFSRLDHVFISHLHGDHFLGLPGLLSTLALHDTGGHVVIHTFEQGADILQKIMAVFCRETSFVIDYDIIKPEQAVILDDKSITVETFPLRHRVPTVGFLFKEKPSLRHLVGDMVKYHEIPFSKLQAIKEGADYVTPDGRVIPNSRLTTDPTPPRSYAYCSDTAFDPKIAEYVRGVDTLFHEATYQADSLAKAAPRGHSTAAQAGEIATLAGARQLVLGHYSQAYNDDSGFEAEARTTFDGPVTAAHEGLRLDL